MSEVIKGLVGKFEVKHWHVGDDIRVFVYNEQDNSLYSRTNSDGARRWVNGLSVNQGAGTITIREDRAVAEITRFPDFIEVVCYDLHHAEHPLTARFDMDQVAEIIRAFKLD